ncbi:hypothetical protein BHM03_00029422 [Ensete ventricosum]|nr:hypothetical protein BHM03_00029422 [Ensete ventricosum]
MWATIVKPQMICHVVFHPIWCPVRTADRPSRRGLILAPTKRRALATVTNTRSSLVVGRVSSTRRLWSAPLSLSLSLALSSLLSCRFGLLPPPSLPSLLPPSSSSSLLTRSIGHASPPFLTL